MYWSPGAAAAPNEDVPLERKRRQAPTLLVLQPIRQSTYVAAQCRARRARTDSIGAADWRRQHSIARLEYSAHRWYCRPLLLRCAPGH